MGLKDEFRKMVSDLSADYTLPPIANIFFPPFYQGGQPKDAQFMAVSLEGGAAGISYVLVPDEKMEEYTALKPPDFIGKNPEGLAFEFGGGDPVKEMIGLASINAICQHVMREIDFEIENAPDSLGLNSVCAEDRIGMVGFFFEIIKTVKKTGADLVVIEKKGRLIKKFPDLPISMDPGELRTCNKVICTSTTLLNNSLDEILANCSPEAFISIIGPSAGYFPDPLFARGIDVVGGRVVRDGEPFLKLLEERKRWGNLTQETCFRKAAYASPLKKDFR